MSYETPARRVAVIGAAMADARCLRDAQEVGRLLAVAGVTVLTGGLGGCMEAAARGVRDAGGVCVGFLPGYDARAANSAVTLPLPTGLGEARNVLVVAGAEAVIALGGGAGTLSEIGLALKLGKRVVALHTWNIQDPCGAKLDVLRADDPVTAVQRALETQMEI